MVLKINYQRYEQRALYTAQLTNSAYLLLCCLLMLAAGFATYLALVNHTPAGLAFTCGALTLVFMVAFTMTLSELLAIKAQQPADLKSIQLLMLLVDQLGNRQEFVDEIADLVREQGHLYQYQANALIVATQKLGISQEAMEKMKRKKGGALGYAR